MVDLMRKDEQKNLENIRNCLKNSEKWLWYREIARQTDLHHKTVGRLIRKHLELEIETHINLPFRFRMIRLKTVPHLAQSVFPESQDY